MWLSTLGDRVRMEIMPYTQFFPCMGGNKWLDLSIIPTRWVDRTNLMRIFTGQYERTIDAKNRIQLPSQLRAVVDAERDGPRLYVTLGEHRGTLSIFTDRGFEQLASRLATEYAAGPESRRFELQFYAVASAVELDKQGRMVIPDRLRKKARLGEEVFLIGQKNRIEVWNRAELDRVMGIDWEGEDWPDWQGFLRRLPMGQPE